MSICLMAGLLKATQLALLFSFSTLSIGFTFKCSFVFVLQFKEQQFSFVFERLSCSKLYMMFSAIMLCLCTLLLAPVSETFVP